MALTPCETLVDSQGRELAVHGTVAFPIAAYHDDLGAVEVAWHWHQELEAVVVSEGACTVAAGNEKYIIRAGEGFFVNSGILHGCWDLKDSGCRFHSLVFHPRLVGGSLDSVFYQDYVLPLTRNTGLESIHLLPDVPWQKRCLEAIEESWRSCVEEPAGYEFRVREALSRLVLALGTNSPTAQARPGSKGLRDGERIKTMLQFIQDHYAEDLNAAAIAGSAAISESECLRCFRSAIGTTPIQYLRQYRLRQAARLLTATREKIADICTQCGFQDVSYFTKVFRESMGVTPSEYRRRQ